MVCAVYRISLKDARRLGIHWSARDVDRLLVLERQAASALGILSDKTKLKLVLRQSACLVQFLTSLRITILFFSILSEQLKAVEHT